MRPKPLYITDHDGAVHDSHYDHFFWNKKAQKKPRRTLEEKAARKENRKAWWSNVGKGIKDAGGVDGILGSVGNFIGAVKSKPSGEPSDFQFQLGGAGETQTPSNKQVVPVAAWVIGGIVVLAIGGYLVNQQRKKQEIRWMSDQALKQP